MTTIIITWGTSWMWKAAALLLAQNWCNVIVWWRSQGHAAELIKDANKMKVDQLIHIVLWDVSQKESNQQLIEKAVQIWWSIDGVFCSAGRHIVWNITQTSFEDRQNLIQDNLNSIYRMLHLVLPHMVTNTYWRIVLMWSDQSTIWKWQSSAYWATKAAIAQLAKSTAIDFAPYNICVNAICPWTIDTRQAHSAAQNFANSEFNWDDELARKAFENAQPIKRVADPSEVAKLVKFLLLDNDWFMTWWLYPIDWWFTAW